MENKKSKKEIIEEIQLQVQNLLQCQICYNKYTDINPALTLNCGHSGCKNCLHNWWFTWTDNYNNTRVQYFAISTEVYYHTQYSKQIEDQYYWLEKALENSKADWKIVIGHRPLYCSSLDYPRCTSDASKIRDGIQGHWQGNKYGFEYLFHTYKVDMYFCGHIHSYERTFPLYKGYYQIFNNNTYTNPNSTVYIISGAAGNREMLTDFYDDHIYGKWSAYR